MVHKTPRSHPAIAFFLFDIIQAVFHIGRKFYAQNIRKAFDQDIADHDCPVPLDETDAHVFPHSHVIV